MWAVAGIKSDMGPSSFMAVSWSSKTPKHQSLKQTPWRTFPSKLRCGFASSAMSFRAEHLAVSIWCFRGCHTWDPTITPPTDRIQRPYGQKKQYTHMGGGQDVTLGTPHPPLTGSKDHMGNIQYTYMGSGQDVTLGTPHPPTDRLQRQYGPYTVYTWEVARV